jgi:Ca2+-binding EF-hand superfamily protein
MAVLVYKTNVQSEHQLNYIQYIFRGIKEIGKWSVDVEDIDKVLRIVISEGVSEEKIVNALSSIGINCEELDNEIPQLIIKVK